MNRHVCGFNGLVCLAIVSPSLASICLAGRASSASLPGGLALLQTRPPPRSLCLQDMHASVCPGCQRHWPAAHFRVMAHQSHAPCLCWRARPARARVRVLLLDLIIDQWTMRQSCVED